MAAADQDETQAMSEGSRAIDWHSLALLQAGVIDGLGSSETFEDVIDPLIRWFAQRLEADVVVVANVDGSVSASTSLADPWQLDLPAASGDSVGWVVIDMPVERRGEAGVSALLPHLVRLASAVVERYQLQWMVSEVLAQERRTIAEALHDDPIQALTAVSLRLQRLQGSADPEQTELLSEVQHSVAGAIERMRSMLFELHPPSLDDEGIEAAIEMYLYERLEPQGIEWDLSVDLDREPASVTRSLVYRLTREALANVARHSGASNVVVRLAAVDGGVAVTVSDDGVGCDVDDALKRRAGHLGTSTSRHLAQRASGTWTLRSEPGAGAEVEFWIPDSTI